MVVRCRLTERISIEKFLNGEQNSNGFDEEKWDEEYYKCWAAYKDVSGKDFIAAKTTNSENIVTFTVRYCNKVKAILYPGANKKFRVKYNDFYYGIEYASDFEKRHEWVDLKCSIIN
ncbi:phage head closure protein [Clostridium baratii]|uniref:phage head closure protein n=1 Tax=Clostridium baratii TaxID=1561 RepID=UPI003D7ABA16